MKAKSVIAIATSLTTFIPILSVDNMTMDEWTHCLETLKRICPKDIFVMVSGDTYEVSAHAKEYAW